MLEGLPALRAGRRAAVDRDRSLERGPLGRDRPRVVARVGLLLVGRVVLLVDADQAEPGQRREDRGARADHDRRLAGSDPLALVTALCVGQRRVQDGHPVAEPRAKAPHGLRRERDLGDEDDHAQPAAQRLAGRLEVDLGLPAAGGAVEQEMASFVEGAPQALQRTLLRLRERARLRFARQGVPLGRLRKLLAPLPLRRRDEREGTTGRRAVVVREPQSQLDERRGQRLDDALDRRGLDPVRRRVLELDHDPALASAAEPDRDDVSAHDVLGHLVRERPRERTRRHERVDRGVVRHAPQASGTARHASLSRRPAEPGSAGRERVAGQGSEIRLRRLR